MLVEFKTLTYRGIPIFWSDNLEEEEDPNIVEGKVISVQDIEQLALVPSQEGEIC